MSTICEAQREAAEHLQGCVECWQAALRVNNRAGIKHWEQKTRQALLKTMVVQRGVSLELISLQVKLIAKRLGVELGQRAQFPLGRCYKFSPTSDSLRITNGVDPVAVDTARMRASFVISTPTVDRVGDSMDPSGCRLNNYRKNPVVLWEHGLSGISTPVARSEDDAGNLLVTIARDGILATGQFTNRNRDSEQIFALIEQKMIRGASVRFTPLAAPKRRNVLGEEVNVFDSWDLEEWSVVGIPCNPEAILSVVSKNRLAGSTLSDGLRQSLRSMVKAA